MAYNEQDKFDNGGNPIGGLIKTAIGLAPLGYAGYRAFGAVKANAAMNPAVPFGVGNLGTVGAGIGQTLAAGARDTRAGDLERLKKLTDDIMAADDVQKLFQAAGEQNALVQSLLEMMDDPTTGLQNSLMGYREKLLDLSRDSTDPEKLREIIQTIVRSIDTQVGETAKVRWERNLREYRNVGPQLQVPRSKLDAGKSYIDLDASSLGKEARGRYDDLVKALGKNGAGRVSLVQTSFGGGKQVYARVYGAGAGKSSYIATLPLHITGNGVVPMFANENLTTAYAAPKYFIDAQKAATLLQGGKAAGFDDVIKQAGISVEDWFLQNFTRHLVNGEGGAFMPDPNKFREWQRQYMNVIPRFAYAVKNPGARKHLITAAHHGMNIAAVVNFGNMDARSQEAVMTGLGSRPELGFEAHAPGYQFLDRGIDNEPIGKIGLLSGSPLKSVRSIGQATRGYFPVESRIEQVFGREGMFVQGKERFMGRGNVLSAGAQAISKGAAITHLRKNIEWAKGVTGATNKAVVIDLSGDVFKSLAGTGVAMGVGRERVRSFSTKPLLDPAEQGYMASKLFEDKILKNAKPGELIPLTLKEVEEHAGFLGIGPNGLQHLRDDPRTTALWVSYNVTQEHGRRQINIALETERFMESYKGFSTMHKGVVQNVRRQHMRKVLKGFGLRSSDLKALNLRLDDIIVSPGDMLKKGAGFFDLQLRSGYAMVSGDKNFDATLRKLARKQQFSVLGDSKLAKTTGAVIKGLAQRVAAGQTTAKEAGLVLGGLWAQGGKGKFLKGLDESQAIEQAQLEAAIKDAFGGHAGGVLAQARRGVALAATSMTQGMGLGDQGLGRGSVEPRFISNLQHRLKNMGFSVDEASEIIGSIYKKKVGFATNMKSASGLLRMAESLTGSAGVLEGLARDDLPTYTLRDLKKLASTDFDELISKHAGGFVLDLTSGADTLSTSAIAHAAKDVFGGQGQLFIPGRDVTDAMKETFIKFAGEDMRIAGDYSSMMTHLFSNLSAVASQSLGSPEASIKTLRAFKERAIDLSARTIMGVARGKVRGMQSMMAQLYDMDKGVLFSDPNRRKIAQALLHKTSGHAVFMDKVGFMSQLNDWMGGSNNKSTLTDAAKKAEMFFLGLEDAVAAGDDKKARKKAIHKAKGIVQITTRHPELSLGNITPIQVFRELGEIGGDDRDVFAFMQSLDNGKYKGVKSWKQVQSMDAGQRHAFFYDFVSNIGHIAPEGGGSIFIPRMVAAVKFGDGTSMQVDMGIAGAAIGDWDGDTWMSMMLNQESGKKIMSTMTKGRRSKWQPADSMYKIKSEVFAEEAKTALKRHHQGQGIEFESRERIVQSLLKENAAKAAVGSLDTRLTKLRIALLDMKMGDKGSSAMVDEALALLKVTQEHAVIKGKKLPVFLPFAENLTKAVDEAFKTGNLNAFRHVMNTQIFPGSKLHDGLQITGVDSPYVHARNIEPTTLRLRDTLDFLEQAVQRARVSGVADMPTANWVSMIMKKDAPEEVQRAVALLNAGGTLESGMISGFEPITAKKVAASIEDTFWKMGKSLATMDRKLMGIAAAGIVASVTALGAISHEGYSPTPMTVPGEVVSPDVRAAINQGNLFSGTSPEMYRSGVDGYAAIHRPNNIPTTYLSQPNAYQIRGNVSGLAGLGSINDYMGTIGSNMSGSIRINDTRMPITSGYVDRLMGEY